MVLDASVEASEPTHGSPGTQERQGNASGWSSLLTWRRPRGADHARKQEQPARQDAQVDVGAARSMEKTSAALYSPPKRMRAPIPFDVEISRSPSASIRSIGANGHPPNAGPSSSSVTLEHLDYNGEVDDDEDDADLSAAFESLARVKDRDGSLSVRRRSVVTSPRSVSFSRHSDVSSPAQPSPPAPADSWFAWGTSTIRSTLPRGMLNALQISTPSEEEETSIYLDPEPFPSPRSTYAVANDEKWKLSPEQDQDRIDHCVDRILGFAGVDEDARCIVTLSMPSVPPNDDISHDTILQRILLRSRPLVENPGGYTLVLFASATPELEGRKGKTIWPGWAWCWKAWRSLGRSYRKNLKKLYIVHPTRFTTTLVRLISTGSYFISPKFAKKIVQCDTLESLGRSLSINQLDIPPEVLLWDLRVSPKQDVELPIQKGDSRVPILVQDCVEALKRPASGGARLMDREGIFRVSPSLALLRSAKYSYTLNRRPNFARFAELDAHLPAALLKDYLRSLPNPMFPASTYACIERCPKATDEEMLQYTRDTILTLLDSEYLMLLSYILQCLHDISQRSEKNRMTSSNLAIVLTPNLIRSDDAVRDVLMCKVDHPQPAPPLAGDQVRQPKSSPAISTKPPDGKVSTSLGTVIAFCIDHYYEVFDEMHLELPTISLDSMLVRPRKGSIGSVSRGAGSSNGKRLYSSPRNGPTSPRTSNTITTNSNILSNLVAPSSPSQDTLKTRRSSSSMPARNRILSGGSLRGLSTMGGGLNLFDKGLESVALVDTSASGQFETSLYTSTGSHRGGNSKSRRMSLDRVGQDHGQDQNQNQDQGDDDDDQTGSAEFSDAHAGSPSLPKRASGPKIDHLVARHDRRPLSEVFEE